MAIVLNGTTGITAPDIDVTAQASDITTTGDITAVDATLSGGVYLGGTGSANHLDDYETGTWTPTAANGFSGFTSVSNAQYVKVGKFVTVTLYAGPLTSPNSNQIVVGGLPFAASGSGYSPGVAEFSGSSPVGFARVQAAASQLNMFKFNMTRGNRENYFGTDLHPTSNHIICQATYITA
jgi:hypothetical protein